MTDDTPIETSEDEARPYQRDPTMDGMATPPGSSEQTPTYGRVDYQAGYNALNEFIRDFEIDSGEGVYFPNDQERFVIEQFVLELMNNDDAKEFIAVNFTTRISASPLAEAASNDEDAYVIDRLAKLLASVCIALKGEAPELHLHSFHDIVEVATALKLELDLYRAQAVASQEATPVSPIGYISADSIKRLNDDRIAAVGTSLNKLPTNNSIAIYAAPQTRKAKLIAVADDTGGDWRRLALQFDDHRMKALAHLRMLLKDPVAHAGVVAEFLAAPPLDGETVLANRVAAMCAAPQEQAPADKDAATEPRIVWSANGEDFREDSLGELLDNNDDLEPGRTVYFGNAVPPTNEYLCDASDILETIGNRAYDFGGEYAEDFPDATQDAIAELETFIAGWITKNCPPTFYQVEKIQQRMLTAEDFDADDERPQSQPQQVAE